MKKISSIILATVIAASMIAGCSSEASAPSESSAVTSALTEATTDPSVTEPYVAQTFEEIYGNQLSNYLGHQYYFDGEPVPISFSDYYFISAFIDLSNYANMGYYPTTALGLYDLAATCEVEDYDTYGDYFVYYTEQELEKACIYLAKAEEAGYSLPEDKEAEIDGYLEDVRNRATDLGLTLDEYYKLQIGPNFDEASYRDVMEKTYIVYYYPKEYCNNYVYTEEERFAPKVRYVVFYAPEEADQDYKDSALASAQSLLDSCSSIDDITGLAETAYADGSVYSYGDTAVTKGFSDADFKEWSYGEDRYEGEMDIIYSPSVGYIVVGYIGIEELDEETLNYLTKSALETEVYKEIDDEIHEFYTNDVFNPAPAGPTATAVPTSIADSISFDANPTGAAQQVAETANTSAPMTAADVLVVVFITLAAIAVLAVVVILIAYSLKNGKNNTDDNGSSPVPRRVYEDDFNDEDINAFIDNMKNEEAESEEPAEDESEEEDEDEPVEYEDPAPSKNSSGNKNQGNKGSNGGSKGSNNGNKNNSNRNNNNRNSSKKKNNKKKH